LLAGDFDLGKISGQPRRTPSSRTCAAAITEADQHQSIWENLPPSQKILLTEREFSAQEWTPLDQRRFRLEPESYRTELFTANLGALRVSRTVNNQAMQLTLRSPGIDGFAISMIERGASRLVFPGTDEPATGLIYRIEPGIESSLESALLRAASIAGACLGCRPGSSTGSSRLYWRGRK
jgi:hypothetical protein